MKMKLMLMGLCALLCYTSCKSHNEKKETEEKLLVTSPLKMDTTVVNDYVGQVRSIRHIELRAQEKGYLEGSYVDEGQHVKKGQLLFKIMPKIYGAEQDKAAAEVNFTEIEYRNTKRLADSNVVAPNELAMAKAKLRKAKAELALSKAHLQFTEIRAPFDGIIDRLQARLGSLIDEGDLITTLADNSQMWVYFNVPEAEYLDYQTQTNKDNSKVTLLMANHKVFNYPGKVETIEADFDNETGNIPFRATFPNPQGLLRHGETGNVQIEVPLKGALIIPQKATFEVLDKKYVYVVDKDNRVQAREIEIGAEMNDLYEVRAGLTANDKILLEGLRKVKNNDKIAYNYQNLKSIIPQLRLPSE
ncbi:efflux RND transporter periplasmic adaptor subunit [Mucilaginibacter roseus]|uniref:Efflux RND transporter periplasmic adaptor subunit n=1 Tax=Mucilaginibacter roseus TaxID=1528868 RepID=A0ABS8U7E2_9SPHI|nr:efflux RND transporter periplasmic adaptor subunit [Mucilaginibacter roseus]MCD8742115.1 efflux RND transporter periplasmic adaptor subunit [Mucilaginibacter roseus]